VAFFWLNLWGEKCFDRLREALRDHPWRLGGVLLALHGWAG
jgi:hypothetical protein